jgi:hypothetical protein
LIEGTKIESEKNKNIRRLMNGQSVLRQKDENDISLVRNVKILR